MSKFDLASSGFMVNPESGNLEKVEFISAVFKIGVEVVKYKAVVGGVEKEFESANLTTYKTREDFEKGERKQKIYMYDHDFAYAGFNNGTGYKFHGGDAVAVDIRDVEFRYLYDKYKLSTTDGIKYHQTREEVFIYNDYTIVDGEGNKTLVKCLANKMAFTDEQKKALENLKNAVAECEKLNIYLFYDLSKGLCATNGDIVENQRVYNCCESVPTDAVCIERFLTAIAPLYTYIGDDDYLYSIGDDTTPKA